MRTLSSALLTELDKTVTEVGYLVQWGTSPVMRWSDLGEITWDSRIWVPVDFTLQGLDFDGEAELSATLTVQNLDSVAAGAFLGAAVPDVAVEIHQFARGALAAGDAPRIAVMAIDGCEIGLDRVTVRLIEQSALSSFAPRRSIDASHGFRFALPAGTMIAWESELFIAEPEDG